MEQLPESHESLWRLAAPPSLWLAHFLASYGTAAIWCAKASEPGGPLGAAATAILVYTLLALAGVGAIGLTSYRRHRLGGATPPHDADTPADRHRFLGFASLLLCGLSAVAVVYETLPLLFIRSCR